MFENFLVTFSEMGLRQWQIISIGLSLIIFPITFFISSKNFDAKSIYNFMKEEKRK